MNFFGFLVFDLSGLMCDVGSHQSNVRYGGSELSHSQKKLKVLGPSLFPCPIAVMQFNPFYAAGLFFFSLKSEKQRFSGLERDQQHEMSNGEKLAVEKAKGTKNGLSIPSSRTFYENARRNRSRRSNTCDILLMQCPKVHRPTVGIDYGYKKCEIGNREGIN